MLLFTLSIIFTQNLAGHQEILLYLFGATTIVVDILRSAINSPVFLTLMQPLSIHERLRAHTIVKGIMDPFASLAVGVLLLIHYQHKVDLLTLSYVLLAIGISWIIGIYRVNSQYFKTVVKTISNRYFNRENFLINDYGTLDWLKEKAKTGTETEVVNILNMLFNRNNGMTDELMMAALKHPSDKVKLVALRLVQQKRFPAAADFFLPFLQAGNSPLIVAESIKIMCRNDIDNDMILPFLNDANVEIKKAALVGLFFYGSAQSKKHTETILMEMASSKDIKERIIVSDILSSQENCSHTEMIRKLMDDKNSVVRRSAYLAAGKSNCGDLIEDLINRLERDEIEIIQALFIAGEFGLPFLQEYITGARATTLQKKIHSIVWQNRWRQSAKIFN